MQTKFRGGDLAGVQPPEIDGELPGHRHDGFLAVLVRMRPARPRGFHLPLASIFPHVAGLLEVGVMLHGLHGGFLLVRSEFVRGAFRFGFHGY